MGWNPFKSEEKISVGTSVVRVIDDAMLVDSTKVALTKALLNDGNISDYLMEELVGGIGIKAERMYKWAESNYLYGLPSGEQYSSTQGRQEVEQIIETQVEGKQVFMQYSHFGAPNALHIGWMKLVANYGYDYETNQLGTLTASKGTPVYLKDMVVVVPEDRVTSINQRVLEQWGVAPCAGYTPQRPMNVGEIRNLIAHSPINTSSSATEVFLKVTYCWQAAGVTQQQTMNLFMSEYGINDGFFHASYLVDNEIKFWIYKNDSGIYPTLDAVFVDAPAESGTYFPFAYLRYNKAPTSTDPSSEAFKDSHRLLKYLNINYADVVASINENPDINDVESAILTMAVPPVSTNNVENRYLFDYFDNLHAVSGGNTSPTAAAILSNIAAGTGVFGQILSSLFNELFVNHTIVIQDARFKMALSHGGIYKRLVAGSLGDVGTYTSTYGSTTVETVTVNQDTGIESTQAMSVKVHRYQHQISKNMYEEVLVSGLKMTYWVWGGYTTVGDETDDILLIPIDRAVTGNYEISIKEELYARSLHFVFNSKVVQKVKWYQQSWFKVVLQVVAVVVMYLTWEAGGSSWAQAIVKIAELEGTAAMVAIVLIDLVLTGMVLQVAFRIFVKAFGQEIAQLLILATMIYLAFTVSTQGIKGCPYAGEMLMLSNGMQQAVFEANYADLLDEQKMFQLYAEEKNKDLEVAEKLLETQTVLSPFTIFGEKPEDYFNRTVHYGNIGTLGITAISSYVDMALTLPKIQDTLGEDIYG
jgi:hypothetical protein